MDSSPAPSVDPRAVLQTMLDGLGLQTKVEPRSQDGELVLHIATVDPDRLIGRNGHVLHQLQFLLNRVLQRLDENAPKVIVDCERYRDQQRTELLKDALAAVDKVRRWGDPVEVGPYGLAERRLIHQHLERDPELEAVANAAADEAAPQKLLIRVKSRR